MKTQWRDFRQFFLPNCPRSWEIPSGRPPWTDPLHFHLPAASNIPNPPQTPPPSVGNPSRDPTSEAEACTWW